MWLEGIDPPTKMAGAPNITALMVATGGQDFGFFLACSRFNPKKKDRERECARDIVEAFDKMPVEDPKAWCQLPSSGDTRQLDLQTLETLVCRRVPKTTLEVPEAAAFVIVNVMPWGPHERSQGTDPDLALLERFDPGFAELQREARRVTGLVRKQWFVSMVWAKPEPKEGMRSVPLGMGLATDAAVAKQRALHSAELRATVLSDQMFSTAGIEAAPPSPGAPAGATDE